MGLPELSLSFSTPVGGSDSAKIIRQVFQVDRTYPRPILGVDPGQVHMGIAVLFGQEANLYEIELESAADTVERIMLVTTVMQTILGFFQWSTPKFQSAIVEGAAYMASHGQVPLETARTAAAIAALQFGIWPVAVVPPKVIRAGVFGNGLVRAQEVWPDIPENAASALGCALYGGWLAEQEVLSKVDKL